MFWRPSGTSPLLSPFTTPFKLMPSSISLWVGEMCDGQAMLSVLGQPCRLAMLRWQPSCLHRMVHVSIGSILPVIQYLTTPKISLVLGDKIIFKSFVNVYPPDILKLRVLHIMFMSFNLLGCKILIRSNTYLMTFSPTVRRLYVHTRSV